MRSYLPFVLAVPILLVATASGVQAQATEAECTTRTGENATLIFPLDMQFELTGASIAPGDVVTATSADGQCVGWMEWTDAGAQAMSVWGDDPMTEAVDGLIAGETIHLQLHTASAPGGQKRIDLTYAEGDGKYVPDAVYVASGAVAQTGVLLAARIMLQGSYLSAQQAMSTALLQSGFLPKQHPFASTAFNGTPLKYDAPAEVPESVFADHPDLVDYVLVELRTTAEAASIVARRPALLKRTGEVVALDGTGSVAFADVEPGSYYVVVRHRNHLPVMSAAAVDLSSGAASYDFTPGPAKAYGSNPMARLADGVYGLYAGDADGNGQIQNSDKNSHWWPTIGKAGYQNGDFNLNGQVQNDDKNLFWWANIGRGVAF